MGYAAAALFGLTSVGAAQGEYAAGTTAANQRDTDLTGHWSDGNRRILITRSGAELRPVYLPLLDDIKVSCALPNGTRAPYEYDFQGTLSDEGKILEGEIRYCRWNTLNLADAGIKSAKLRLKISPDGTRMEGCYKTPYQKGGQRFRVTADYARAEVKLRIHAPPPALTVSLPDPATLSPERNATPCVVGCTVRDGDPVGVTGKIAQHLLGPRTPSRPRSPRVNWPALARASPASCR